MTGRENRERTSTLGLMVTTPGWAEEQALFDPPEDALEIDHIHGKSDQAIEFNHSSHESFECIDCHHFAPAKNRPSCLACHTNEMGAEDKDMTGCSSSACHPGGIH